MLTAASPYPDTAGIATYQPSTRPVFRQILINMVPIFLFHVLAVIGILYYPPSWPLVITAIVYHFSLQWLGITFVYHRCLAHRSFDFKNKWVERLFTTIGTLSLQNGPLWWCSIHRIHHQNSDSKGDPHNSRLGFWYAHLFWLVHLDHRWGLPPKPENYKYWVKDIASDPYYVWLDKHCLTPPFIFFSLLYFAGGWAWLFWVGIVMSVIHMHFTWLVNSASHILGYRTFQTSCSDKSKNNWLIALLAKGEGWHNNHHANPSSAKHGFLWWWEFDLTYLVILLMEKLGLIHNVKRLTGKNCKPLGIVSSQNKYKEVVKDVFSDMNVELQGTGPCDIRVHNDGFYKRFISDGSLGLGESYMDGWWDCERIDELFARIVRSNLSQKLGKNLKFVLFSLRARLSNFAKRSRAFEIGERHYDLGNELFQNMLDKRLIYSCAYWKGTASLDEAQENKLRMVCDKIGLKSGMRVLDIGCGWGGFAKFAAQNYGVEVVGITVSKKQLELGQKICAGLSIELRLQDYRDLKGEFDRIVSIGMFEHVGYKNHKAYMKIVHSCLKENGVFFLQTIGRNETALVPDPWIEKYIFPNSLSPSIRQIAESTEGLWIMEDWANLGMDYDKTLMSWHENFRLNWSNIKHKYDDRFYRMWSYFLLMCAGLFRSRYVQLWQIVFTKHPGSKH